MLSLGRFYPSARSLMQKKGGKLLRSLPQVNYHIWDFEQRLAYVTRHFVFNEQVFLGIECRSRDPNKATLDSLYSRLVDQVRNRREHEESDEENVDVDLPSPQLLEESGAGNSMKDLLKIQASAAVEMQQQQRANKITPLMT